MKQVVFLTVNHRGPLPLRELHSTDDTIDIVWRDPGGSWACLRPVSDYEWIQPSRGCMWHKHNYTYLPSLWSGSFFFFFFTVNHRGPLPLWELHSTDETIVWRDPGGSEPVYDLGCSLLQLVGCLVVGLLQAEAVLPNPVDCPCCSASWTSQQGQSTGIGNTASACRRPTTRHVLLANSADFFGDLNGLWNMITQWLIASVYTQAFFSRL